MLLLGRRPDHARKKYRPRFPLWNTDRISISDERLVTLLSELSELPELPELAEAARASQRTVDSFVPPRLGLVEETFARRHQLVFGRRGVGKSTLLRMIERHATERGDPVVYIDLETLRGIPYPDVLIQLLIKLCSQLGENVKAPKGGGLRDRLAAVRARRRLSKLSGALGGLLEAPQEAEHTVSKLKRRAAKAGASVTVPSTVAALNGSASAELSTEEASRASFKRTKMEGLYAAAPMIRDELETVMKRLGERSAFIVTTQVVVVGGSRQPRQPSRRSPRMASLPGWQLVVVS